MCVCVCVCVYQSQSTPFHPGNHFFLISVIKFYIKMIFTGFQNTKNFLKISPNIYYIIILKTQLKKNAFIIVFMYSLKHLKKFLLLWLTLKQYKLVLFKILPLTGRHLIVWPIIIILTFASCETDSQQYQETMKIIFKYSVEITMSHALYTVDHHY